MGGMGGMDPGMMQAGRGSECTGACWSTDGSAINSDACTCGEDVCAMNQFCDASAASGSECTSAKSAFQACSSTDGSAINSDACTCGEDVCAMNQFCDASAASGSE